MTYNDLISFCKPIDISGPRPDALGMLSQDSRKVGENGIFIAIKGHAVDGHQYIDEAINKGASLIICDEPFYTDRDVCVLEVSDTRSLVGPLAQALKNNPAENLTVIGVTGTNGKTTVATLIYQSLQNMGEKASLLGTVSKRINNRVLDSHLTTSDPIEIASDMELMLNEGSEYLVMEVSSHALDQQRVDGIPFKAAIFTNLSHDHLDYHKSFKSYAFAKKKLFDRLTKSAYAIINADDAKASIMEMDCSARIVDFSFRNASGIPCKLVSNTTKGLELSIGDITVKSPLAGTFNAYNIAEAYLSCSVLGFESQKIAQAIAKAPGAQGRLQRVDTSNKEEQPTVFVDYAHTPDALKNVTGTLRQLKDRDEELIVVFGCGGNRDRSKRPEMAKIAQQRADSVIVTSDNPRSEDPNAIIEEIVAGFESPDRVEVIPDRRKAIQHAISSANANSIILIAGKGHERYQEINDEKYHFDDFETASQALGNRNPNSNKRTS